LLKNKASQAFQLKPVRFVLFGACCSLLGLFFLSMMVVTASAAAASSPSFFNTKELKSNDLKAFTKWNKALARYSKERSASGSGGCGSAKLNTCNYGKWMSFLKSLKDKDLVSQIRAINDYMNRAPYITDAVNWGKKDFWASPGEFMAKFGDCEDYAIAKYVSLRLLGYKDADLRVVAVKDLNLKIGHAILVVYYKGTPYVLDNQIKQVVPAAKIKHYLPVFSINSKSWWKHLPS